MRLCNLFIAFIALAFSSTPASNQELPSASHQPVFPPGVVVEEIQKNLEGEKVAEKDYQQALAESRNSVAENLAFAGNLRDMGSVALERGELDRAEKYYQQSLAITTKLAPAGLAVAKSLKGLGDVAEKRRELAKAKKYYRQALAISQRLYPDGPDVADSLYGLSRVALDDADPSKRTGQYIVQALAIRRRLAPNSLETAISLNILGDYRLRTDRTRAEECYREALAIEERLAPNGLAFALSLSGLGALAELRGDHAQAGTYHHQALAIRERLAPGSVAVVTSLSWLGSASYNNSELEEDKVRAEQYWRQALALAEKLNLKSLEVAHLFRHLGDLAYSRYDLAKAEQYYRQALAVSERIGPGGRPVVATTLMTLGRIARIRGDLIGDERYHQRALAIWRQLGPEGLDVAYSLYELGVLALDRGEVVLADRYYRRALAICQKLAPGSPLVASALDGLGDVSRARRDLSQAERYYREELQIERKVEPGGADEAASLQSLGEVLQEDHDLAAAEDCYRQALAIRERVSPGSIGHAETLAALAGIMRRKNEFDKAAQLYQDALGALDVQAAHLGGGDDVRADFRARHAEYATNYIDLLVSRGQHELALQVLESSRARNLLEMLTLAHVDIHQGVDAGLLAKERSLRRSLAAKSNRRLQLLSLDHTEEQIAAIDREIEGLLDLQRQLKEQIRTSGPGYAALVTPFSLTAKEIQQQLLDSQTVLLEYSLGRERSHVFVVTPEAVAGYELPKRVEIERQARQVYEILTARNRAIPGEDEPHRLARWAKADAEYPVVAAELSRSVLGPVAAQIATAKRLLVVSDGSLAYIPFSALPAPQISSDTSQSKLSAPLMLEHEIVTLPSASVLAVLRRQELGRGRASKGVAVLADPVFTKEDSRVTGSPQDKVSDDTDASLSSGLLTRALTDVNGKLQLPRLRFTRQEAANILAVTPGGENLQALDFQASRQTVISASLAQYRIVHFATHGLLDSKHPELSGLVLSLIDQQGRPQNGFLNLEDIYNLNLPADLVVLSACETGLGKQVNGEGLVGLTRGFMYAGASRVVASLWRVSDMATSKWMGRFYQAMESEKMPPAAALRAAQIAIWKQPRWRSPYFWAAFQIQGEWK